MNNSLKIGLDIHGVIDSFPEKFKQLSYALAKDGAEVHIITGKTRDNTYRRGTSQGRNKIHSLFLNR